MPETLPPPQSFDKTSEDAVTISQTTTQVSGRSGVSLRFDGVSKQYPGQAAPAVENFSLDVRPGELVMFVGPSGCGKTTTMKMANRIIEPTSGTITLDGRDVQKGNPDELRRHIGYVIQQIGLFPHFTIEENIAVVPKLLGWNRKRIADRVEELLLTVRLDPATFARRYPRQLSGGQQQRVGVARALASDPPVMLMDEPFGATDPITREQLQSEFAHLQRTIGKTIVFVTHDFEEALLLGDRIAVLGERSSIQQFDTPSAILAAPANDYVRSFIGSGVALKRLALISIEDAVLSPARGQGPVVGVERSMRDALDLLISSGATSVDVRGANGNSIGSLTHADVSAALDRPARVGEA